MSRAGAEHKMTIEFVEKLSIESLVISEFRKRGFIVSNVCILPSGTDGIWLIGEAFCPVSMPYEVARDIEQNLLNYRIRYYW